MIEQETDVEVGTLITELLLINTAEDAGVRAKSSRMVGVMRICVCACVHDWSQGMKEGAQDEGRERTR